MRIGAGTMLSGQAGVDHYDSDGRRRIAAVTFPGGTADIRIADDKGKTVWGKTSK